MNTENRFSGRNRRSAHGGHCIHRLPAFCGQDFSFLPHRSCRSRVHRIFGRYVNGREKWIGIGELGTAVRAIKLVYILFLAYFLTVPINPNPPSPLRESAHDNGCSDAAHPFTAGPRTSLVYIPIFLGMALIAGIPLRYINIVLVGGGLLALFTVLPLWEENIFRHPVPAIRILTDMRLTLITMVTLSIIAALSLLGRLWYKNKYYYWITYCTGIVLFALIGSIGASRVIKDYQIMRLIVFLDPSVDPLGSGWNIIQSITAIGSGGFSGLGFLQGTQSHYRFLPQQSTDFIFSILSEEWGFVGGLTVFSLYLVIMIRGIIIIRKTENRFGTLIATGIVSMFLFHFTVNVGMVMGIMPITGIPLLFLSYGGSSLWTALSATGLLMSINMRRLDH